MILIGKHERFFDWEFLHGDLWRNVEIHKEFMSKLFNGNMRNCDYD